MSTLRSRSTARIDSARPLTARSWAQCTLNSAALRVLPQVALEESKAELDSLIRSANAPIFQIDRQGVIATCNPTAASMLGHAQAALVGRAFVGLVPDDSRDDVEHVLAAALSGVETKMYELVLLSARGERVEVLLNATARRDASGEVLGIVGVGQDMTLLRQQMAEKERLRTVVNSVATKYERALDSLTDVVFEVWASSWEVADWRVGEHSASFKTLFQGVCTDDPGHIVHALHCTRALFSPWRVLCL
jgi:PAS domain S-box-containing protein